MAMEHVVNINVRISQKLADEMDALVNEGRHSTRADVLRTALIVYLNSTSILADKVAEMVEAGELDECLERRMPEIFTRMTLQAK